MSTVRKTLAIFAVCAFPIVAYAQIDLPLKVLVYEDNGITHSTGEAAELLIAVGEIPGNRDDSDILVNHGFALHTGSGVFLGAVSVDAPADGLAKFSIMVGHETSSGEASLIVNGQEFCCVPVENNRVSYRVNARRSRVGRNPFTGAEIQIPASVPMSITNTVFNMTTGETQATGFFPNTRDYVGVTLDEDLL